MHVWRIFDHLAAYALSAKFDPLDGQGAALYPGRWNHVGVKVLYTSQSPELGMLELLTKIDPERFSLRMAIEIELPAEARVQDAAPHLLDKALRGEKGDTQSYGSEWVESRQSLVLRVPSAVLPVSYNYLINPLHPQAKGLRILRQVEIALDPRFVRKFKP